MDIASMTKSSSSQTFETKKMASESNSNDDDYEQPTDFIGNNFEHEDVEEPAIQTDELKVEPSPITKVEESTKPKNKDPFEGHPLPVIAPDPMFEKVAESCAVKTIFSGAIGFLFGFGIGSFFTMGLNPSTESLEGMTFRQQVVEGFKQSGRNGWSMGKGFASAGVLFAGSECLIEQYRGKTDLAGTVASGCISGALLAVRAGPQSMLVGCAGFAAFSAVIDHILHIILNTYLDLFILLNLITFHRSA